MSEDQNEERYNLNDPEQKAKLKKKLGTDISIEIDDKAQREFNEKILEKLGDKEAVTSDVLADRKLQAYEKFNHDERFLQATTQAELTQMVTDYVNEAHEKGKVAPSGSASLEGQYSQGSQDLYKMKFDNPKTMIAVLSKLAREGNVEAESYLNSITKKWIDAKKANPQTPDQFYDPNKPENMPDLKDVPNYPFKVPFDQKEGELGKIVEAFRQQDPRVRRAREQLEKVREQQ